MTRHFGNPWSTDKVPVGSECSFCNEVFVDEDVGVSIPWNGDGKSGFAHYHKNCFLRTIIGSVGHQRKQCSCFGGTLEDPLELSLREAANAAVREFEEVEGSGL